MSASTAMADYRVGSAADSRDMTTEPDIERLQVAYDTSGALQVVVRFFGGVPDRSPRMRVDIGSRSSDDGTCEFGAEADVSVAFSPQRGADPEALVSLIGYQGEVPAASRLSDDGKDIYIEVVHPTLARRWYACVEDATLFGVQESDEVPGFKLFGPGAFGECADGIDNDADGQVDESDAGCESASDEDERLTTVPEITYSDAVSNLRTALTRRFGGAFKQRVGWRRSCTRASRTRFTCRVGWGSGKARYAGTAAIWFSRAGENVQWNYAWRITMNDARCKGSGCTKTYVVQ
jgi:hypothetical protein